MINIAEKLKNAPKGTKLYSPIFGECILYDATSYGISVKDCTGTSRTFDCYGRYYPMFGECTLFPHKDKWHWDNFTIKKEDDFKPFDKVVVRETYGAKWSVNFFSNYEYGTDYPYRCLNDVYFCCLPYNEETAKLIGTTDDYEE